MVKNGIEWQFNVERAPWWGGVFERMVLRKIIGTAKLTFDEFMTAIVEVEALLNSRPLTYLSADELTVPLTPSHLMCGSRIMTLPDPPAKEEEDDYPPGSHQSTSKLTRRLKHLTLTLERFWTRWRREYLLELRATHASNKREARGTEKVRVGDVVVIEEDKVPRSFWT